MAITTSRSANPASSRLFQRGATARFAGRSSREQPTEARRKQSFNNLRHPPGQYEGRPG
jgi:hypothetical protein